MDLCTVEQIRNRLRQPSDPVQDQVIDALRLAVEERILAVTGFLAPNDPYFTPISQTDERVDVQLGVSRLMTYRPILPMGPDPSTYVKLTARSMASNTFSQILGEVRSLKDGRIMPLASELTPVFPPVGGQAPWFRWRQMIWPVVRFTYLVDPLGSPTNPIPPSLTAAAIEWVAFTYVRPNAGATTQYSAEKISETFLQKLLVMPPIVSALLARYIRGQGGLVY